MATIRKVSYSGPKLDIINYGNIYTLNKNLSCGDSYKTGLSHRFDGTEKQVKILIEIIKKFRISQLTDVTKTSFIITSKHGNYEQFMFRLIRLVRTPETMSILEETLRLNKENKITIHNAFVIAHHVIAITCNYDINTYCQGMDLIYLHSTYINISFKRLKDFDAFLLKKNAYTDFNQIFYLDGNPPGEVMKELKTKVPSINSEMRTTRTTLFKDFIKNKEYKKAERLIANRIF